MGSSEGVKWNVVALGKWDLSHWQGDSITENGKKNVKNGNWGLNSFNGIDIPPSGPSLYLTVDLAFIQGCSVILCLKADRHFTRIIIFFLSPFIDN